jgi:hypothetical protein
MENLTLDTLKHLAFDRGRPVSDDHIAGAIVSVIQSARSKGQSLDDVMVELLADDALLDQNLRHLLGDIVAQAWQQVP